MCAHLDELRRSGKDVARAAIAFLRLGECNGDTDVEPLRPTARSGRPRAVT